MKSRKLLKLIVLSSLSAVLTLNAPEIQATESSPDDTDESTETSELLNQDFESVVEAPYYQVLADWESEGMRVDSVFEAVISPSSFSDFEEDQLVSQDQSEGYGRDVLRFENEESVSFEVTVPEEGLYHIDMDYYRLNEGLIDPELSITVNDELQHFESRRIIAPTYWENETDDFDTNRAGHELVPNQVAINEWQNTRFNDPNNEASEGLFFLLSEGVNTITLTNARGSMLMGDIRVYASSPLPTYTDYFSSIDAQQAEDYLEVYEAELPTYKNSSYIRPISRKDVNVHPYDPARQLLNIFGGDSWSRGGQSVTYEIDVPRDGFYHVTFKTLQNEKQNVPVFRTIEVNGTIPFEELKHYRMVASNDWMNQTLIDEEGEPYSIYLEEGTNTLTLTADITPLSPIVNGLNELLQEVNTLGLSISRLTGNQPDRNRDWVISEFIPDVEERFTEWITLLEGYAEELNTLYGDLDSETTDEVSLGLIISTFESLREEPNQLPNRLSELSEGSSSTTQMMGDLISELQNSPLSMDQLFVHSDVNHLPDPTVGFFTQVGSKVREFVASFTTRTFDVGETEDDVLEVWVGRNQQYVELMQNMVDATYTAETGQEVILSVMPNEQKLILANSSNQQPDIALGVSVGQPWELAVRGAAYDLRQFEDFEEFSTNFSPGAFMPYMIDDAVYAMPETQDFYVLFYRTDIMDQLDIPIPDTWDDVLAILPELQRYGMNFYVPLSGSAGIKPFMFTAPFIYQFGGDIYAEDGMSTAIDSEGSVQGMQFMTDLYSLYSLPIEVPNFYNAFRYGELPIGVSNFQTYVQLLSAAPEIRNSWDISVHPGVVQEDGSVNRSTPGSAQSAMIFNQSDMPEESWDFMKWWLSAETQTDFATNLQTLYGPEYMWHPANLNAFSQLPWDEEHKDVILEQWEHLEEVPKIPGSYMVEREISNAWTGTVFYDENIRASLDYSVITANREITRKMEEFNYIDNGEVVTPYRVPQLETVEEWMNQNVEE